MSMLVPRAELYLEQNMNVLLVGPAGTGKTESVMELARKNDLRMKYFSCSTLDPFTDLVGVPVPHTRPDGSQELRMIRPREIDEAEFIFFDEFNRASNEVLNAVFEIIQFGTINGEPLPKLRCCWAAMNPNDGVYQVNDLDPALVDRFDAYVKVDPRPSVHYMVKHGIQQHIAEAIISWWRDHNKDPKRQGPENYVSPRRLFKLAQLYQVSQEINAGLVPWGNFDRQKLTKSLRDADERHGEKVGGLGEGAAAFNYTPSGLMEQRDQIVAFLRENPSSIETHRKVLAVLETLPSARVIEDLAELLNAILPALLEGSPVLNSPVKSQKLRECFAELSAERQKQLSNLSKLF